MMNATLEDMAQPAALQRHHEKGSPARERRINARDAEWQQFARRLAETLGCLESGHYLVLQTRDEEPYYVQFAAGGADGMHAEAVSNRYLEGWRRLDATAHGRLRRLGWRPPTDIGEGPVNWWRSFPAGHPAGRIAGLAVDTLRKVFEVSRPVALVYWAFAHSGEEILLPALGIDRRLKAPSVEQRVEAALREYLELDELARDDDGDWPVRSGDNMVYVRVVADLDYAAVFSPALLEVAPSPDLLAAVNEFNTSIRCARAAVTGGTVMVAAEVDDQPEMGAGVVNAFKAVSELTQACADKLQGDFGGRRFFEESLSGPAQEPGYGMYL